MGAIISAKSCIYSRATCAKPKHDRTASKVVGRARLVMVDIKVGCYFLIVLWSAFDAFKYPSDYPQL